MVVVDLKIGNVKIVIFYCFYYFDLLFEFFLEFNLFLWKNIELVCILLFGDFNLLEFNWVNDEIIIILVNNSSCVDYKIFCDFVGDNFFY